MDSSLWCDKINMERSIVYIEGSQDVISKIVEIHPVVKKMQVLAKI